jgi:hypothetical protein
MTDLKDRAHARAFLAALTRLSRVHGIVLVDTYAASSVDGLKLLRLEPSERLTRYYRDSSRGIVSAVVLREAKGKGRRKS